MDSVLVIIGMSIFLAGTALYINATLKKSPSLLVASVLFPPAIVYVHSRFWQKSRFSAYLQVIGLGFVSFGLLAGIQQHPEKYNFSALRPLVGWIGARHTLADNVGTVGLPELIRNINANDGKLSGHLGSAIFELDHAEFIGGVLRFIDKTHQQEVGLILGVEAEQLPEQWSRYIEPNQLGVTLQIVKSGSDIQSFNSGYKLSLRLNKLLPNKVSGNVEILFSDQRRSFLVGTFEAVTNQLRYRGGDIDRTLENDDTVFYVIKDYLKTNFPDQITKVVSIEGVQRHYENGVQFASSPIVVEMADGEAHSFDIATIKRDTGWEVSENNSTQLLTAVQTMQKVAPASGHPQFKIQAKPIDLEREMFFAKANAYLGRWMEVELVGGLVQRGLLAEVGANTIALKPAAAGVDKALLTVRRDNIVKVRIPVEK